MTAIDEQVERLARFDPVGMPVISLYLDARANQHGKDAFDAFVRKEFSERSKAFPQGSEELKSFKADAERIHGFLKSQRDPSANGIAIFACSAYEGFFEVLQLDAPIEQNMLYVGDSPNLYYLARLSDQNPRYAVLVADTNAARIFVIAARQLQQNQELQNVKTRGTSMGGWSQARYQRHIANYHLHHAKEVVDRLEKIVAAEGVDKILICGDEVIVPTLRDQLPQHLAEKITDILRMDIRTPEHEIITTTLEKLREKDAETDVAKVERLLAEYRAGGLAVVGTADTLAALGIGQVDELIISASPTILDGEAVLEAHTANHHVLAVVSGADRNGEEGTAAAQVATGGDADEAAKEIAADTLVTAAKQTGARVTFIEDAALLKDIGGVGALLRYKV
jgi:peptide chain release factor subunit 1